MQKALSSEDNYLLGAEVWHFDSQTSGSKESIFDEQMSQFSQNKSLNEILNNYISQFQLEPCHLVA